MVIVGPVRCIPAVTNEFICSKIKAQYPADFSNAKSLHIIDGKYWLQLKFILRGTYLAFFPKNQHPFLDPRKNQVIKWSDTPTRRKRTGIHISLLKSFTRVDAMKFMMI